MRNRLEINWLGATVTADLYIKMTGKNLEKVKQCNISQVLLENVPSQSNHHNQIIMCNQIITIKSSQSNHHNQIIIKSSQSNHQQILPSRPDPQTFSIKPRSLESTIIWSIKSRYPYPHSHSYPDPNSQSYPDPHSQSYPDPNSEYQPGHRSLD